MEPMSGNERVTVPGHLLSPRGGDHYVLRVVGDSMREDAICDGDYVIVLRRETAEPGDMAVVLVGDDASIKRVYPDGDKVRLESANPQFQPLLFRAEEVRVQGIVVGLMRKY